MRSIGIGIVVLGVLAASCSPQQPTAPSSVIPTQTVTVIIGGPTASPSPAAGAVAFVKIGAFGQNCPAGITPSSQDHSVRVGCTLALTCTPKDANGNLLPPAITGLQPDFFGVTNGGAFVRASPWDQEAFNLNVLGVAAGAFSVDCTDKGVRADRWDGVVIP